MYSIEERNMIDKEGYQLANISFVSGTDSISCSYSTSTRGPPVTFTYVNITQKVAWRIIVLTSWFLFWSFLWRFFGSRRCSFPFSKHGFLRWFFIRFSAFILIFRTFLGLVSGCLYDNKGQNSSPQLRELRDVR